MIAKFTKLQQLITVSIMAVCPSVWAIDMSGFMSIGGGIAKEGSDYPSEGTRGYRPASYEIYSDDFQFRDSTVFGLQFGESISDQTYLSAQILTTGENEYSPELSWAFLKHKITPNTDLSVGRFSAPFYMFSESINVGYTYLWVRPPADAYRVDIESMDGVKLRHRMQALNGYFDFEIFRGEGEEDIIKANSFSGVTTSYSWEWLTLRGQYSTWDIDWLANPVNGTAIENPDALGVDYKYTSFGLQVDRDNLIVISEVMLLEAVNFRGQDFETDSKYITLGYRFGPVTPHITYSKFEREKTGPTEQEIITLGTRWDTDYGFSVKLEYLQREHKNIEASSGNIDVLAFSIDAVF